MTAREKHESSDGRPNCSNRTAMMRNEQPDTDDQKRERHSARCCASMFPLRRHEHAHDVRERWDRPINVIRSVAADRPRL